MAQAGQEDASHHWGDGATEDAFYSPVPVLTNKEKLLAEGDRVPSAVRDNAPYCCDRAVTHPLVYAQAQLVRVRAFGLIGRTDERFPGRQNSIVTVLP